MHRQPFHMTLLCVYSTLFNIKCSHNAFYSKSAVFWHYKNIILITIILRLAGHVFHNKVCDMKFGLLLFVFSAEEQIWRILDAN